MRIVEHDDTEEVFFPTQHNHENTTLKTRLPQTFDETVEHLQLQKRL